MIVFSITNTSLQFLMLKTLPKSMYIMQPVTNLNEPPEPTTDHNGQGYDKPLYYQYQIITCISKLLLSIIITFLLHTSADTILNNHIMREMKKQPNKNQSQWREKPHQKLQSHM